MKYLPTPLNIAAAILIIFAIYSYVTAPKAGDGPRNFWVSPMIGVAIMALVIDYFLQRHTQGYWRMFTIEAVLLLIALGGFYMATFSMHRSKTLVLSANFDNKLVVIVYEVEGAPKYCSKSSKSCELTIPENGILITSMESEDFPTMGIKSHSGEELLSSEFLTWHLPSFGGYLNCGENSYPYDARKIVSKKIDQDVLYKDEKIIEDFRKEEETFREQLPKLCEDIKMNQLSQ